MRRLALASVAVLALAGAAQAQTPAPAPAAAPAPAPAPTLTPEQQAAVSGIQAKGQAFGMAMQAMGDRMSTVARTPGIAAADRDRQLDAIQAEYQPQADAFLTEVENVIRTVAPAAEQAEALAQAQEIKTAPASIRAQVVAQASAPAAPAPSAQ